MKRMLSKLIPLAYFFIVSIPLSTFSQSGNILPPNYSIHSPNVTSLGKYGDYPVDMSTGVPSIEIPLYTVKSGGLELPISISYHASGVKVDQESSFIGLGWVLNAGGVVTRILKDKKDEGSSGFLHTGSTLPDYNSITGMLAGAGAIGNSPALLSLTNIDKEPDIFNIVSKGLSGEFCLDNLGKYVSRNLDSLKYDVDLLNNLIVIKDRRGNIFRFGKDLNNVEAFESTNMVSSSNGTSHIYEYHSSSWHLTEMISRDSKDTIKFTYKTRFYSEVKPINVTRHILRSDVIQNVNHALGSDTEITSLETTIPNVRILDKIFFKNGFLEFYTEDDRIDSRMLKTRIIGFNVFDQGRKCIQSIVFDNADYFNRTASVNFIDNANLNQNIERTKSLKLNSVKFLNENLSFNSEYKFEYDMTPLPARNTTSQDFWGYYNGSPNTTFIPATFYLDHRGKPSVFGSNRNSDFNYMKAGCLNKVIFPTGGHTAYEYEPNYYLDTIQSQNLVKQKKSFNMAAVNRLSTCSPTFFPNVPANNVVEYIPTENIVEYSGKLLVEFSDFLVGNDQSMRFKLTEDGIEIFSFSRAPSSNHQILVYDYPISLKRGSVYRFEANTNGVTGSNVSICNSPYVQATLTYDHWIPTTNQNITPQQAGGLRVKSISNFDSGNNVIKKVNYEYGDRKYSYDNVGVGRLITDPRKNFYIYPLLTWSASNQYATFYDYIWFSSDSQIELGMNNGCPVFYNKVTEKVVSNILSAGKTENYYEYEGIYYEPRGSSKYPYESPKYHPWANVLVKTISYAQLPDGSYSPIKSADYTYNRLPEKRIKTLVITDFQPDIYKIELDSWGGQRYYNNNPSRYFYYNFYIPRGRLVKDKEKIVEYVNGTESLITENYFEYNKYFDISKEKTLNSKSEIIETVYQYSGDLNYSILKDKFMVSLPVQNQSLLNGKVKSGKLLKYNDFGSVIEYFEFKSSDPVLNIPYVDKDNIPYYFEKKEQYNFDLNRKIIQEVLKDGKKKCYLWSYNNQYIIAEIDNSDYSSIEAILIKNNIEQFSKLNPSKSEIENFIFPLRSAISHANITTYSYNPLIGMASSTDPKGQTTYYEYDGFQRLKSIKDQNGNIVKSYDYHYKP